MPPRAAFRREATWRVGVIIEESRITPHQSDGDGWVRCAQGHRHWGRFGAAGVLVTHGSQVLLAHRAAWTHQGGAWAVPGGARDSHESVQEAALRELGEETSLDPAAVTTVGEWFDDHGGWRYTTVVAHTDRAWPVGPREQQFHGHRVAESDDVRWWPLDQVADLHLHPGFAVAWPHLRALLDEQTAPDAHGGSAGDLP